jgi:hypothetical protein
MQIIVHLVWLFWLMTLPLHQLIIHINQKAYEKDSYYHCRNGGLGAGLRRRLSHKHEPERSFRPQSLSGGKD